MAQGLVDSWMAEWIQQGIQQGVQQGVRQTQDQMIRRLLVRGGFSPEEIASLVDVDIARVREMAECSGRGS